MLNVVKEQNGNTLVIRLSGSIEESVDFNKLIGPTATEIQVNCKGVSRINSVGVKAWIKYFKGLSDQGVKITFVECSTAIVEQINLISNFTCGGTVESIFVPFSCTQCHAELLGLYKVESLKKAGFKIPPLKCTKCGGEAEFDDIPDEYFNFAMNE